MRITLYHNPRCSKSREGLALLESAGVALEVVEYLKNPPTEKELLKLLELVDDPAAIVRVKEPSYSKFDLTDKRAIARELARHPELLERPIAVKGSVAVVGRPPENFKKLL